MKVRLLAAALFTSCAAVVFSGCNHSVTSTTLELETQQCLLNQYVYKTTQTSECLPNTLISFPGIRVSGAFQQAYPPTSGNVLAFGAAFNDPIVATQQSVAGDYAFYGINNVELPAQWLLDFDVPGNCGNNYILYYFDPGDSDIPWYRYQYSVNITSTTSVQNYTCYYSSNTISAASTRFAVIGNFPGSITLSGNVPFITQFGMPVLYVYDQNSNLVATETATSVSSDQTQATFPFPSSLSQNAYELIPEDQINESPGFAPAGLNLLSIAQSQTISGNPFGVAVGAQTTETINCVYVEEGNPPHETTQCTTSSSNPDTIPVVSLYSANKVMIGSTLVNVGANPTAVGTYAVSPVTNTTTTGSGYTTTILSGSLRAIVANSGSDTVTILNTVTDAPVATVTVGNQPVALVVSTSGGTAYVANYKDSTITAVNLSTNTAAGTVAVGGHPTSVALTAGGTLWVGGAGFLTEINTSNMSVVGTENVPNRNIIALSYSDQLGELMVQSTDSAGNVYEDQTSSTSFTAGGTYQAIASQTISTLGTYTVGSDQVRAFTATLSGSSALPINLPGAPPLVVQDGWLVVTATPTGFTITDANDNVVLISQATTSPIAAIAVDTNLRIVYLTEPDSNTLLMVPLPGTATN